MCCYGQTLLVKFWLSCSCIILAIQRQQVMFNCTEVQYPCGSCIATMVCPVQIRTRVTRLGCFEQSWSQSFQQNLPNYIVTLWHILVNATIKAKTTGLLFEKIEYFLINNLVTLFLAHNLCMSFLCWSRTTILTKIKLTEYFRQPNVLTMIQFAQIL